MHPCHTRAMARSGEVSRRTFLAGAAAAAALAGCANTSSEDDAAAEATGAAEGPLEAAPTAPTSSAPISPAPTEVPPTDATPTPTSSPEEPSTTPDGLPLRRLGRIDWLASAITIGGS